MLCPYAARPLYVCTLSFFTIKVLPRLFQVWRLHKSFPFSLLHHITLISPRKLRVSSRDQSPDNRRTASPRLIFSPPAPFPPRPTVSSHFYCQRSDVSEHSSRYPKAPFQSRLFDCFFPRPGTAVGCSVDRSCGLVNQFIFFFYESFSEDFCLN